MKINFESEGDKPFGHRLTPRFQSMKRLGVSLLPSPAFLSGCQENFAVTHLLLGVKRGNVRVTCKYLAQVDGDYDTRQIPATKFVV